MAFGHSKFQNRVHSQMFFSLMNRRKKVTHCRWNFFTQKRDNYTKKLLFLMPDEAGSISSSQFSLCSSRCCSFTQSRVLSGDFGITYDSTGLLGFQYRSLKYLTLLLGSQGILINPYSSLGFLKVLWVSLGIFRNVSNSSFCFFRVS